MALVARGDESALGELHDRVGRVAYGIAFRILRDDRLAEDAVQEGFLAVWRSAATFRPERAKASTWIRRLRPPPRRRPRGGRNVVAPSRSRQPIAWRPRPGGLGGGRGMARLRARSRPGSAADAPLDGQREAIELAYYGGYSQCELAERLGVPLGTVESRMFAGLHGCARCWTTPEQRDHGRRESPS